MATRPLGSFGWFDQQRPPDHHPIPGTNVDVTDSGLVLRPSLTHVRKSPGFRALERGA